MRRTRKPRPNVWKNEHCPTYDPKVEGFGSTENWEADFRVRMGLDEAKQVLGEDDPLVILGLQIGFTEVDLKRAYRAACMKWHPDMNKADNAELEFKRCTAAYVKLRDSLS